MQTDGEKVHSHIMKKYGLTPHDCKQTLDQMTTLGAEAGFKFDFCDGFKMVNTGDLHVLLEHTKEFNKQTELKL